MVMESDKEVLIELKSCWKLNHDLPYTVQELSEDGRCLSNVSSQMTTPVTMNIIFTLSGPIEVVSVYRSKSIA